MDHKLALYTFGLFIEPADHPSIDGFHQLNDRILPVVDRAHGLVGRSGYDGEEGPDSWGEQVFPRFFVDCKDDWAPSTLSLWDSIEAAMAFSYFGPHAEALKRGREWNVLPKWPPYVAWWWPKGESLTWADATARHELLHDQGPTPAAFNFKQAFGPDDVAISVDHAEMKRIAALNAVDL